MIRLHPRSLSDACQSDGGAFDYEAAPRIFLGRRGLGPLRIAWDTDIVIDWETFGLDLLNQEDPGEAGVAGDYRTELEALGSLMGLWMSRDVRIVVSALQLDDDRRRRRVAEAVTRRVATVEQIMSAQACVFGHDGLESGPVWSVEVLPANMDRRLIEQAVASGCHVFLTRDRQIAKKADLIANAVGLVVAKPTTLLYELAAADALDGFGDDGLVADSHKWQHLWNVAGAS